MKTNERKRLHLYIISTALLSINGFFFAANEKKCSDKKRKGKAIFFEHIKLEIPKIPQNQTGNAPQAAAGTQENKHSSWQ